MSKQPGLFEGANVIYAYSRAQALEDGLLVDLSRLGQEAGITFPLAVTEAVWERCIKVPDGVSGQDEEGRAWDIAWMLRCAIRASRGADPSLLYFVLHVRNSNRRGAPPTVRLKAVCGPGDNAEPVLTVMFPEED